MPESAVNADNKNVSEYLRRYMSFFLYAKAGERAGAHFAATGAQFIRQSDTAADAQTLRIRPL